MVRFAENYGLQVVGSSRDSMDVQVKGPVATIETAFHVNMRIYQHPTENRTFYGVRCRTNGGPAIQPVAYLGIR